MAEIVNRTYGSVVSGSSGDDTIANFGYRVTILGGGAMISFTIAATK